MAERPPASATRPTRRRPLFGSKLLWIAFACAILGGGWWVYAATQASSAPPATPPNSPAANPLTSLVDSGTPHAAPPQASAPAPSAPIPLRAGLGFMGGYFVAYLMRKFIKITLLVGGAIAVAIVALKATGVFQFDWNAIEAQTGAALDQAQAHASTAKDWIVAQLPSGASALVGLFIGARRD